MLDKPTQSNKTISHLCPWGLVRPSSTRECNSIRLLSNSPYQSSSCSRRCPYRGTGRVAYSSLWATPWWKGYASSLDCYLHHLAHPAIQWVHLGSGMCHSRVEVYSSRGSQSAVSESSQPIDTPCSWRQSEHCSPHWSSFESVRLLAELSRWWLSLERDNSSTSARICHVEQQCLRLGEGCHWRRRAYLQRSPFARSYSFYSRQLVTSRAHTWTKWIQYREAIHARGWIYARAWYTRSATSR